jgi:DNA-directed RNA polymerase subunit RPC12/RpoP
MPAGRIADDRRGNTERDEVQMIKFRCGQCGQRIAVHKRQMNAVVVCPDCEAVTHPMAEQVLQRRAALAITALKAAGTSHTCANCSQTIGKLQKLHLWDNKVVCGGCHQKLSAENTAALLPAPTTPVMVTRRKSRGLSDSSYPDPSLDPLAQTLTRPFRGGLFGAMVGLCVAAAALYGAMSLLREVAGVVTGLAIGGLALLVIYMGVRSFLLARREEPEVRPARRLQITERNPN